MTQINKDLMKTFIEKYAEEPSVFKSKILPWLNGSIQVLDNSMRTLTPEIIANKQHPYNLWDQWGGNIKQTSTEVRSRLGRLRASINAYPAKKIYNEIRTIKAILAANPQYKTNPFFKLKPQTTYSLETCVNSIEALCQEEINKKV